MHFVYLKKNITNHLKYKKINKTSRFSCFFVLLFAICVVFFLSCSNIYNEAYSKNNDFKNSRTLQMNITSDKGYILFSPKEESAEQNSSCKTIMPSYDFSNFVYYLYYKKVNETNSATIIENIIFKPISQTTGTISHTFSKDYYEFNLFALTTQMSEKMKNNNSETSLMQLRNYASFYASTFIDLRNESTTVFHLKPNSYLNGAGSFKINISHQDDWEIAGNYKVTAGIYSIDDDTLIYPNSPFVIRDTQYSSSSVKDHIISSFESDVTEQIQTVPKGTYNLSVRYTLYDSSNTNPLKTFEYSEKIEIIMNQTTVDDFVIPDFLDKKPEAPSKLTAAYKLPQSDDSEYYTVEFIWEDNSKTEQYFNLELLRTDSSETIPLISSDETWEQLSNTYGGSESYNHLSSKKSIFFVEGSLSKNSASYTMKLPLGSRYVARINAVNNIGTSSWAYLTFPTIQEFENNGMSFNSDFYVFTSETPGDVSALNLYRINYETRNGSFEAIKNESAANLPLTTLYNIQHNTTQNALLLFYPNGSSCEYITSMSGSVENATTTTVDSLKLTFDDNIWQYWTQNSFTNEIKITSDSSYIYNDYKNVTFFAHYENDDYLLSNNSANDKYADYYLNAEDIIIHFLKDGLFTTQLTESITLSNSNLTIAMLDNENGVSRDYIQVSKAKVSSIQINTNEIKIDQRKYDSAQLTVKRCKDSSVMTTQTLSSENIKNAFSFGFLSDEWTTDEYYIEISFHSSEFENSTFCYSLYLSLLE